ncbi:MAG: carboxypeptidase M32 [Anaerolineales bacterium]|nr:carboxypeptidase M32 [Anaerolineales bacterium]
MKDKLDQLREILGEIKDLSYASAILSWDEQVNMPAKGSRERGEQLATLGRIAHTKFTSDGVGELLEELEPYAKTLDPDSNEARLIKQTRRDYDIQARVPSEYVSREARATSAAHQSWVMARQASDFSLFQDNLQNIIELKREYSSYFAPSEHPYDPLLDQYEPGLKTLEVKEIFDSLRPRQVELIKAIAAAPQVDSSFLYLDYPEKDQWNFGVAVISDFGYEWDRGRQDYSPHPFSTSFGLDDVRITTRVYNDFFNSGLFSTLHECGHALYELGIDPALARTPLADGTSLGVHESQSRMWENLVGRSLPFWDHYYPKLVEVFPSQLGNVSKESFYKAVNKVEPSMIRVEADEATYNLHIMLRLGIEIALIEGSLDVADLPEAWDQGMEDYLGIRPADQAEGVLQDVHWSMGLLGYFSTYALGNLISAQLWERIREDIPNLDDQIRRGDFGELLGWNREKIHRHGAKFEPQELIERVTGSRINPDPYVRYLAEKYSTIYGLG